MKKISIKDQIGGGYNRFWHNKNFYRVVKGSRGSKKSKTAALNFIYRIMKYPWSNLLVVRRFSNTLRQSTYTDLKWAINKLGVSHLWKTNESMPELTYMPTGQKIIFRGLDDPLKITSITVDVGILSWAWFEEAYEIETEDKFRTVVESIRGSYDAPDFFKQITVTFNPWSERHWLKRVFFDEETQEGDTFATTTTFRVNEWLDDQDRERYMSLYNTNPRRARIVCDGEWGIAEGRVYENYVIEEFETEDLRRHQMQHKHGLDFGYKNDPTAFVTIFVHEREKKLYIVDEHYQTGMLNSDIASMLKYKGVAKEKITADSAEPKSIDELKQQGIVRIRPAKKGRDSVRAGIQKIQDYQIIIHPRCKNFIIEIENYVYQKKDDKATNEPIDDYNHLMDAMRYALEEIGKNNPLDRYKKMMRR